MVGTFSEMKINGNNKSYGRLKTEIYVFPHLIKSKVQGLKLREIQN